MKDEDRAARSEAANLICITNLWFPVFHLVFDSVGACELVHP